jgi:hypothetical protein
MPRTHGIFWRVWRRSITLGFGAFVALAVPAAAATVTARDEVMVGIYPNDQWNSAEHIRAVTAAAGKSISIGGLWFNLDEPAVNVDHLLEEVWSAQATPFVNIHVQSSSSRVAAGDLDAQITSLMASIKSWLDRAGGRSVLLAPMQEMNGDWVPYGMDPFNYQPAFRRFVELGRAAGLTDTKTRWVFAPNAWSRPPHRIADYYPGADVVDLVGISAYNGGASNGGWLTVYQTIGPALEELRSFAPEKPFIVAQIASSTEGGDRDAWLREMFAYLATDPNVIAFIYFDIDKESDWSIYREGELAAGFRDGMLQPATVHKFPLTEVFLPGALQVPFEGRFADDETSPFQEDIEWLVDNGITLGCDSFRFCPTAGVTREQMASFLARGLSLPAATEDYFTDDTGSPHEPDINRIREAGITLGCGPASFCPTAVATRAEMASFLTRALSLPPATADYFTDDAGSVHETAINALLQAGITTGCGPQLFCPEATVTREQMAAFLHRGLV